MTPIGGKAQEVDANVKAFVRPPPIGMSTLDLLAGSSSDVWNGQAVPAKVRREMHQLVKTEMAETLRTQQAEGPRVNDINTLGLPKDAPPLSLNNLKPKFVHGTPVQRRLIAGRMIRTTELDNCVLSSSISAPELSRAIAREIKGLKEHPEVEQDALDLALSSSSSPQQDPKSHMKTSPQRELSPAEKERTALRQQESQLQLKLLHATQKLTRKYQKQLDPRKGSTTCKIHTLAQKWEEQQSQHEAKAEVDNEQYNLYVAGRFSTQTELDYHQRKIEPREPATDKHRRPTMHTKYGNALAKNKCSLRGPF